MARKGRSLLITLCVIVGLVIVAAVAVRLLLTKERLLAIVIPQVEKAVDAKVSIEDIGINFPFGFGIDIDGLSFEKTLPDTSSLSFTSKKVTARASLISLLKRKPEIKAVGVQEGAVTVSKPGGRELRFLGIDMNGRMSPTGDGFAVSAKALIDSLLVSAPGRPPAITLERVGVEGEIESDREFNRILVKDSKVRWEDLVAAKITGEVANLKTAPRLVLKVELDERPLAPILAKVKGFKLDELSPAKERPVKAAASKTPVEVLGGTFDGIISLEGLAKEPLAMNLSFECDLKGLSMRAGDMMSIAALNAALKGEGAALALQELFPDPAKPVTPAEISVAWRAVKLEGKVEIAGGDFLLQQSSPAPGASSGVSAAEAQQSTGTAQPVRISALKAKAELAGPDVPKISGDFNIGSSPFKFNASLTNIMPAAAELSRVARSLQESSQTGPIELGSVLDRMVNAPVVKLELEGRSFDARPYQKKLSGAPQGQPDGSARVPEAAAGDGAGAVLFLKNTSFTAKVDSIVAREAVLTKIDAKGAIRDGRAVVDPVTFTYAGGKGTVTVNSDLRKPARVETKVKFSLDGVEAGEALARLTPAGNLVQGKFSFKSDANIVTGAGIEPLKALTAVGSALSSRGVVSFESFVEPLSKIQGFDVTPFERFDFNDWAGTFAVKDGRFITNDWRIDSSRGAWLIKGSFGFDGTLDYAVHVVIPPEVQGMMKDLEKYREAFDLMRDAEGNLVLDMKLSGTARRPSASLDLTKAKSKVQDKLIEGLKKKFLR